MPIEYTTHKCTDVCRINFEIYGKKRIQIPKLCSYTVAAFIDIL